MKLLSTFLKSIFFSTVIGLSANAQSVVTDPVGFVNITIAAGTGSTKTVTPISLPLLAATSASGQTVGQITGVTANSFTNTNANWTPGQLSGPSTPHVFRVTSGVAKGRTFLVSVTFANTATTLTIDSLDLVNITNNDLATLGVVNGDTYALYACDTLSGLFGNPTSTAIVGGTSASAADSVILAVNGALATYYYNTTNARWTRSSLGSPDATNIPIRPDAGISFSRIGNTPITLSITGGVPTIIRQASIVNSGVTYLAQGWPVDLTISSCAIQNTPSWVSNPSPSVADTIQVADTVSGVIKTYWFDGTNWRRQSLGSPISDGDLVTQGSSITINKRGTTAGASVLSQNTPYTL